MQPVARRARAAALLRVVDGRRAQRAGDERVALRSRGDRVGVPVPRAARAALGAAGRPKVFGGQVMGQALRAATSRWMATRPGAATATTGSIKSTPVWKSPRRRRRVDGVEDDAMIQQFKQRLKF